MELERITMIERQPRAFLSGVIEKINDEWVFFENETDDAYPLEDFIFREVQVESLNHWNTGILTDKFTIQYHHTQYILQNHDKIKIRKTLTISFQAWLESLDDDVFFQFIHTLNRINFSIYDILYCYNHLSFQIHEKKQGVNFLVFDNMEKLCSVHHHFDYKTNKKSDRFEFTLNTGQRFILQDMHPPKLIE